MFTSLFAQDVSHVMLVNLIILKRTKEHTYTKGNKNKQNAICEHLSSCTHCSHIANLFKIDTNSFNSNQFSVSQIRENTIILDRGNNWNILLSKEALMIKEQVITKLWIKGL